MPHDLNPPAQVENPTLQLSKKRQLVICCDGTNNNLTGRDHDTNVVKLCELLRRSPVETTVLFYDPGVGNPGELPGATWVDKFNHVAERISGLAFGRGVYENISQCYRFLMDIYQPEDEIFIFGFSRGAFTARSVAGLVNMFGILQPQMESMLPSLLHIYFSDREIAPQNAQAIAKQTSELFVAPNARNVEITFIGVWDTVASVGMPPFGARITSVPTIDNKRFLNVRQALALDEHRAQFKPRLYKDENGSYRTVNGHPATLEQRWFRGAHCDVGGGYGQASSGISDQALAWLVSEAVQCGLHLSSQRLELHTESGVAAVLPPRAQGVVHSEQHITCLWALTGLAVRDTATVVLDDGIAFSVVPVEHASVAAPVVQFPVNTVWVQARRQGWFWLWLCVIVILFFALGQLLSGVSARVDSWHDLRAWPTQFLSWAMHNFAFSKWQLLWLLDFGLAPGLANFDSPRWAVVWDFALIAAYAYVLSWLAVSAFAHRAGLRRAGDPVSNWLNRLGLALPLMVFADILENIATWVAITLHINELHVLAVLAGLVMSALASFKFIGFAGVLCLCFWRRR